MPHPACLLANPHGIGAWASQGKSHRGHAPLPARTTSSCSSEPGREGGSHARRPVGIRLALLTTERLLWNCGDHTAKPESAPGGRFLITTISCCCVARVCVRQEEGATGRGYARGRRRLSSTRPREPAAKLGRLLYSKRICRAGPGPDGVDALGVMCAGRLSGSPLILATPAPCVAW